jgi:hypothetical protein
MRNRLLQVETRAGDPIPAGDMMIIPMAKSTQIRFPGLPGGIIWNRPASVVVQTSAGQEYVLPVRDITRRIQFALLGGGLIGIFLTWLIIKATNLKNERRTNHE